MRTLLGEVQGRTPYRGTRGTWDIDSPRTGYEPKDALELSVLSCQLSGEVALSSINPDLSDG